jgi:hypothetical protein
MPNINFYKIGYGYYNILLSLIFFYIDYRLYVFNATQQYFSCIVAVSFILMAEHGVSTENHLHLQYWDHRGQNGIEVGLASTYRISSYYHFHLLMYSIQLYLIKFVNDLWWQVSGFLWILCGVEYNIPQS